MAKLTKAEKAELGRLTQAQVNEVNMLRRAGASKETLAAAKSENKTEKSTARTTLSADGVQTLIPEGQGYISTTGNAYANVPSLLSVQDDLNRGGQFLAQYGLTQSHKTGAHSSSGITLRAAAAMSDALANDGDITRQELREAGLVKNFPVVYEKIWDRVSPFYDAEGNRIGISEDAIQGRMKQVKGQENLFTVKSGLAEGKNLTQLVQRNPDGTYSAVNSTFGNVNTRAGLAAFGPLLTALNVAASFVNPALGAATSAATTAAQGGDFSDILTSAGMSLAGSYLLPQVIPGSFQSYLDDIARSADDFLTGGLRTARPTVPAGTSPVSLLDDVGYPAGSSILDDLAARGGVMNQINPNVATNIPGTGFTAGSLATPGGYGLTSAVPGVSEAVQNAFANVAFANADEVVNAARQAAQAAGQNISLTMPGGTQIVTATPQGAVSYRDFTQRPGLFDDLAQGARNLADEAYRAIRENPLEALGIAGLLAGGGGGDGDTGGTGRPPRLAPDIDLTEPGQFGPGGGAIPGVTPGNLDFNAFMDLYRRGGLGAGQYLGYDLARMLGDIPAQTLLGTPTLGGMIGQAPTSQASLV